MHAKVVLVRVGNETWSAVGSLNGGEISHKLNREVVLLVDHPAIYDRLLEVFLHDWALTTRCRRGYLTAPLQGPPLRLVSSPRPPH